MSGLLGAVAGGAAGVLGGWDDNRQKIKEEANKAYAMKLESLRASNNMANTAEKGRLRAEEAGTERDFKANQNRLDRSSLEKRAGAGGKGGENQQYKAMAKTHQFLMEKEGKTPDEVKHMSWLGKQLGVGMPVDPNKKSLADTMKDFDANKEDGGELGAQAPTAKPKGLLADAGHLTQKAPAEAVNRTRQNDGGGSRRQKLLEDKADQAFNQVTDYINTVRSGGKAAPPSRTVFLMLDNLYQNPKTTPDQKQQIKQAIEEAIALSKQAN